MKNNLGNTDRIIRTLIALVIFFLYGYDIIDGTGGAILLGIAFILIVTSVLGTCPLYSLFGLNSCPFKKAHWCDYARIRRSNACGQVDQMGLAHLYSASRISANSSKSIRWMCTQNLSQIRLLFIVSSPPDEYQMELLCFRLYSLIAIRNNTLSE